MNSTSPRQILPELAPEKRKAVRKKQVPHVCADGRMNEAAASVRLEVSTSTLRAWRAAGKGPAYLKLGRVWYYSEDVEQWLARQMVEPNS